MKKTPATAQRVSKIEGALIVPGDKSISIRSLILGSNAIGVTKITGLLESEDVLNVKNMLCSLGVKIKKEGNEFIVEGRGVGGLNKPSGILYAGNSGTGIRLVAGLLSSYPFISQFDGDESLRSRPMKRIFEPLSLMGAEFISNENKPPFSLRGTDMPLPISYKLPVASAQVKSAIMLAALNISGTTQIIETEKTRDHTEIMMKYLGIDVSTKEVGGENIIEVKGLPYFKAKDISVPGDPSSAAFIVAASLIVPGSFVVIKNICINPLRIGFYKVLQKAGADIKFTNIRNICGEKIADIEVRYTKLKGFEVPAEIAPSMIDEYPILSVIASFCEGKTIMKGIGELRVKESDRLSAIAEGLKKNGVTVVEGKDFLEIEGGAGNVKGGGEIATYHDHRIAMSFYVMGLASKEPITIDDTSMINTSFPGFEALIKSISK